MGRWSACGDPRRMGICETWAAVYGLRDVGLRTLQFFVNCRRTTDVYGGSSVQAYRNPAPVSADMRPVWGNWDTWGLRMCMESTGMYGGAV